MSISRQFDFDFLFHFREDRIILSLRNLSFIDDHCECCRRWNVFSWLFVCGDEVKLQRDERN